MRPELLDVLGEGAPPVLLERVHDPRVPHLRGADDLRGLQLRGAAVSDPER
ncbi:MAG TPA: hypothetical protein VFI25_11055 [Planctomycetota bacterium]|nr:hypothetical protein [Planctomycetota bacterium]